MGQYWLVVNLDRKEFLNPHRVGCGLKLGEQLHTFPGTPNALLMLCSAMPIRRGGGNINPSTVVGRWAGNRVAVVGDYAEDDDFPMKDGDIPASKIYGECKADVSSKFTDISDLVAEAIEDEFNGKFVGDGWREFKVNDQE